MDGSNRGERDVEVDVLVVPPLIWRQEKGDEAAQLQVGAGSDGAKHFTVNTENMRRCIYYIFHMYT